MAYIIRINGIDYLITDYAAHRMLQRYISDDMVIAAIEKGALIEQTHGRDILEAEIWDNEAEQTRIIRVVIDANSRTVVTLYEESTDTDEE